jgi:hypothetical protein
MSSSNRETSLTAEKDKKGSLGKNKQTWVLPMLLNFLPP